MQTSAHLTKRSGTKAEVGTVMTYRSLVDADAWRDATLRDLASGVLDDAYRGLGLKRVSFWLERDPDGAMAMWEGTDIDTVLERYAASSDPVLARWRGQLRVFSGPEAAEGFWDATRHRLGSWETGQEGAESEITIIRDASQAKILHQMALDFELDASLKSLVDRIRRRQGFTRIEAWGQQSEGEEICLLLFEAHDLEAANAEIAAEKNEFDKQTMKLWRSAVQTHSPPSTAKLLARWHA
jgi:hypothetical protein